MENNDQAAGFAFLNEPQVQKHFAELNIELLRGKHIMASSAAFFALLDGYESEFAGFYRNLYGLNLERRSHDGTSYFYLDFPVSGKGKLTNPAYYAEMDGKTTVVACILANLYLSNFFSYDKKVEWDEIRYEIEHGEHHEAYQQLFFGEGRAEQTDNEWKNVQKMFGTVINFFDRIGLVEKEDSDEVIQFTILAPVHHFIELYDNEITDIDKFLESVKI